MQKYQKTIFFHFKNSLAALPQNSTFFQNFEQNKTSRSIKIIVEEPQDCRILPATPAIARAIWHIDGHWRQKKFFWKILKIRRLTSSTTYTFGRAPPNLRDAAARRRWTTADGTRAVRTRRGWTPATRRRCVSSSTRHRTVAGAACARVGPTTIINITKKIYLIIVKSGC